MFFLICRLCPCCRHNINIWFISDKVDLNSAEKEQAKNQRSVEFYKLYNSFGAENVKFEKLFDDNSTLINDCLNEDNKKVLTLSQINQLKVQQENFKNCGKSIMSEMWYCLSAPIYGKRKLLISDLTKRQKKIISDLNQKRIFLLKMLKKSTIV